jgi:aromatic-L-amino-acid decarboxylase
MPGMTHWQHPSFFAYFPANVSYPGMMGEMLSGMFNVIGFSWICSPACTELETIVMDWLCKALGLPETFLSTGKGGGVIQSTASESTLIALLAARTKCIKNGAKAEDLVVYMSDQAHSSVQKACMIAGISNFRILESNKDCQLDRSVLLDQIKVDISKGLTPCFLCATLGTTSTSACDPLDELGLVCQENNIWMHIDAAYVGASFLCEEFRPFMKGIEFANSFAFNPHKWMLTNFECCAMWVKDRKYLLDALDITPEYLRNKASESGLVIDYRSWQIPLGRRFRSLKLWFVMRSYGITGLQDFIRFHVSLAKRFEDFMKVDKRFELTHKRNFSLICFKLKNQSNERNKQLLEKINATGKLYLVHSEVKKVYFLRMAIGGTFTTQKQIEEAFEIISTTADKILSE